MIKKLITVLHNLLKKVEIAIKGVRLENVFVSKRDSASNEKEIGIFVVDLLRDYL